MSVILVPNRIPAPGSKEWLAQAEEAFQAALRSEKKGDPTAANIALGHAVFFEEQGKRAATSSKD